MSQLPTEPPASETKIGSGWLKLADDLAEELLRLEPPGALLGVSLDGNGLPKFRVRLDRGARARGRELVSRYEALATECCETCGGPARVRGGVVVQIVCDDCWDR